jgi:glycosyltransferase involved in cell wall biosynthesis
VNSWSVGLVCGHYDPTRDGVADYTRHLQDYLNRAGVRAVICTAYTYASNSRADVVGVTSAWDTRGVMQAARQFRKLRLDLVHVQFAPSAFGFSREVGLLPLLLHRPSVVTLHEYGIWAGDGIAGGLRSAAWSILERRGYVDRETLLLTPRADRVLVVTDEHARLLQHRFTSRPVNPTVVPVGSNIPVSTIYPDRARRMVRQELGMAADAPLVLFFGFQHRVKALDRLIAATAHVRTQFPGIRLVLAGGEKSHSVDGAAAGDLRRELEEVAHRHGVAADVTFTGYLPARDISCLLHAADVAVFPFDTGVTAKSGSLLAARTHGLPVVATAAPGTVTCPTQIDGVLRVPPKDTAALTEALRLVLGNRPVAERLAAVNRSHAAASTWEVIVRMHLEAYEAVMRSRRHRLD